MSSLKIMARIADEDMSAACEIIKNEILSLSHFFHPSVDLRPPSSR